MIGEREGTSRHVSRLKGTGPREGTRHLDEIRDRETSADQHVMCRSGRTATDAEAVGDDARRRDRENGLMIGTSSGRDTPVTDRGVVGSRSQ
jgi:hypothetical protein